MSFQQGLSGLNASSKNLSVIGNNIANANTFGAKTSRAEFADVYAASLGGAGTNNIGIGTNLVSVAQQFTQGGITTTENPMDLAINGAGFFQMTDGINPPLYTRNGQFKVDRDGYIINNAQMRLMGYQADDEGAIQTGQAVPLQLPTGLKDPRETDEIMLGMNLNSAQVGTPAIDFEDPKTYSSTSVIVYDTSGAQVELTLYFHKTDAVDANGVSTGEWNIYTKADGAPFPGDPPASLGTITFPPGDQAVVTQSFNLVDVPVSSGVPIALIELNLDRVTQFANPFAVTSLGQSGYAAGKLTSVNVESNGIAMARYSNGRSQPVGQVQLATFRNPQGLQPTGDNMWASTFASSEPVRGVPGDGNLGVLQSGALEESNVDLTGELVNMITAQRLYQANAQTIKTQDQVLQTLVNLR
ncbi:MAG: flagellar hook protein FlgE [Chitinophagaceae bacterium]|nr:flagellar hook protein FlgE [Rubrivivax sp.]